jgi:hypothetical protein
MLKHPIFWLMFLMMSLMGNRIAQYPGRPRAPASYRYIVGT